MVAARRDLREIRLPQETRQPFLKYLFMADLALPNHEDMPALSAQPPGILAVALAVPFEFGEPIIEPGLWAVGEPARSMWVPVAAIDLNDLPQARKDQVRASGESAHMQPVAVAHPVNQPAYGHLG